MSQFDGYHLNPVQEEEEGLPDEDEEEIEVDISALGHSVASDDEDNNRFVRVFNECAKESPREKFKSTGGTLQPPQPRLTRNSSLNKSRASSSKVLARTNSVPKILPSVVKSLDSKEPSKDSTSNHRDTVKNNLKEEISKNFEVPDEFSKKVSALSTCQKSRPVICRQKSLNRTMSTSVLRIKRKKSFWNKADRTGQ